MASLDILILLDATGSMSSIIDGVKTNINDLVVKIMEKEQGSLIRLGIVAYRDYDDAPIYECFDFSEDIEAFKMFLGMLEAKGGGDDAEDILTGFEKAIEMNWQGDARMIVHFADAPCHGDIYHNFDISDSYREGDKYGRLPGDLLKKLNEECNVNTYQFMHLNKMTKKMIKKFKEEYNVSDWYKEEDLHIDNLRQMTQFMFQSSIASIATSRNLSSVHPVTPALLTPDITEKQKPKKVKYFV